jgi:hypothetical protein
MILRPDEISLKESDAWVVILAKSLKMAPRTKKVLMAKVEFSKRQPAQRLDCVEPARQPMEGVLVARALSRPFQTPLLTQPGGHTTGSIRQVTDS